MIMVLKRTGYHLHFARPNEDARIRRPSLNSTNLPSTPIATAAVFPSILIKPPDNIV